MGKTMNYSSAGGWELGETVFDSRALGKCEAIMSLGNGYLGLRSAMEERYTNERRGLFVAGTFNKFDENEVTELPNAADFLNLDIEVNDHHFSAVRGEMTDYYRTLNFKNGELVRTVRWTDPDGNKYELEFRRIVSLANLHTIAQRVSVKPLTNAAKIKVITGINGQITNSGSQHFSEGVKRFYDKKYMQMVQTTTESKIDFVYSTVVNFSMGGEEAETKNRIVMDRRKMFSEYVLTVEARNSVVLEKVSTVYTSRDLECEGLTLDQIQEIGLESVKNGSAKGYDTLLAESAAKWNDTVWNSIPVTVKSENPIDQLALRFMQYHLQIMTPAHDNRMNIAAKGLSGEGYKGHIFWDTEIFALPYFIFSQPEAARSLEEYRYQSLPGAHLKAKEGGYEGAQFPWESAWLADGEVTPKMGAADIITGTQTPILSGPIELHITCDVAYALWEYFTATGDTDFMEKYGYELIFDTAKFWASRLEWSENDKQYHINDVIGPDEYKEHIDDNAFTNYFVHWNIKKAIECYDQLKTEQPELFARLAAKLDLERVYKNWNDKLPKIMIPKPRAEDGVIAQNSTFLSLKDIDLTKYKQQEHVGSMFLDYNLEQVNGIQVTKQADLMLLLLVMGSAFSKDVKKANWDYYEPRTLHDSSLSFAPHSVLANDMGEYDLAYELFQRASRIDMGENMHSSDDGIHAGSIGGIWQCAVYGFGGVRLLDGKLCISPRLPKFWTQLDFYLWWRGQKLHVTTTKSGIFIDNISRKSEVVLEVLGKQYKFTDTLTVEV